MRNNPIIVQKYGGACLETPAKIRAVASNLADLHSRGHRVVAIVSAMGKATDELIKMAYQVSPHPNRRELDMLLTTGERISMSLMSMALSDLGVPAISFTGSQAGVTDGSIPPRAFWMYGRFACMRNLIMGVLWCWQDFKA